MRVRLEGRRQWNINGGGRRHFLASLSLLLSGGTRPLREGCCLSEHIYLHIHLHLPPPPPSPLLLTHLYLPLPLIQPSHTLYICLSKTTASHTPVSPVLSTLPQTLLYTCVFLTPLTSLTTPVIPLSSFPPDTLILYRLHPTDSLKPSSVPPKCPLPLPLPPEPNPMLTVLQQIPDENK